MRVLFYLPVVTPWWFDNIVVHLIRTLASVAEVHVVVAPLWRNTGITPENFMGLQDLPGISWHICDGDDHPLIRTDAARHAELMDLVVAIDADVTLCRSADMAATGQFPGQVRYIMEGGVPPLECPSDCVVIQPAMFDYGVLPTLASQHRAWLRDAIAPIWNDLHARHRIDRTADWRGRLGLPNSGRVIALPLEYAHEENFYTRYSRCGSNPDLVRDIAERLPDGWSLAITNHPLNELYVDNSALYAAVDELPGRAVLVPAPFVSGIGTLDLAGLCDGILLENSKSFAAAAFHGTPLHRHSAFPTGTWLRSYGTPEALFDAIADGSARGPDSDDAKSWFAYHLANSVIDPDHADTDAAALLGHILNPCDPTRWEAGIDRYLRQRTEGRVQSPDESDAAANMRGGEDNSGPSHAQREPVLC